MTSKTARKKAARGKNAPATERGTIEVELEALLEWLKRSGTRATRDGMARYAIPSENAFGVTVAALRGKAKQLGPSHELAAALWATGWYEARLLAAFIDEPARVTAAQMDRWCSDFDNWGCATPCVFTCSTARRTPGERPRNGLDGEASSRNAVASR